MFVCFSCSATEEVCLTGRVKVGVTAKSNRQVLLRAPGDVLWLNDGAAVISGTPEMLNMSTQLSLNRRGQGWERRGGQGVASTGQVNPSNHRLTGK